jgi:endonuclease
MSEYRTMKDLIKEACLTEGQFPSYEKLTPLVMQHFPNSKWKRRVYYRFKSLIDNESNGIEFNGIAESDIEETIEASLSLEKDLHAYLAAKVDIIEMGLSIVDNGVEFQTDAGRIDILAKDTNDHIVVIELKAGKAKDNALGQILGYMGCVPTIEKFQNIPVRGILIASSFEQRVVYAAKALPNLKLVKYQLSFDFQEIT